MKNQTKSSMQRVPIKSNKRILFVSGVFCGNMNVRIDLVYKMEEMAQSKMSHWVQVFAIKPKNLSVIPVPTWQQLRPNPHRLSLTSMCAMTYVHVYTHAIVIIKINVTLKKKELRDESRHSYSVFGITFALRNVLNILKYR